MQAKKKQRKVGPDLRQYRLAREGPAGVFAGILLTPKGWKARLFRDFIGECSSTPQRICSLDGVAYGVMFAQRDEGVVS
jgi:hypothetical protein